MKDPARRPTINQILNMPIIKSRISNFLEDSDYKDEFSHTLLHNKDVFKEFQRRMEEDKRRKEEEELAAQRRMQQQEQAAREVQRKREEEERVRKQMEQLQINQYRAPDKYMNEYQN